MRKMLKTNRYGKKIRTLYNEIISKQRAKYECPKCHSKTLRRVSFSMWECKKCGFKMAGGAYTPYTEIGEFVLKMLGER